MLNPNKLFIINTVKDLGMLYYNIENDDFVPFRVGKTGFKCKEAEDYNLKGQVIFYKDLIKFKDEICKEIQVQDLEYRTRVKFIPLVSGYTKKLESNVEIDKGIVKIIKGLNDFGMDTAFSCQGGFGLQAQDLNKAVKIENEHKIEAKKGHRNIILYRDIHGDLMDACSSYLTLKKTEKSTKFIEFIKKQKVQYISTIDENQLKGTGAVYSLYSGYRDGRDKFVSCSYPKGKISELTMYNMVKVTSGFWEELIELFREFKGKQNEEFFYSVDLSL